MKMYSNNLVHYIEAERENLFQLYFLVEHDKLEKCKFRIGKDIPKDIVFKTFSLFIFMTLTSLFRVFILIVFVCLRCWKNL